VTLDQQPRLERWARRHGHAVEQFAVESQQGGAVRRLDAPDVDFDVRAERGVDGIAAERLLEAEGPAQLGERSAHRTQRILGLVEK
jgi:hypothetical protein